VTEGDKKCVIPTTTSNNNGLLSTAGVKVCCQYFLSEYFERQGPTHCHRSGTAAAATETTSTENGKIQLNFLFPQLFEYKCKQFVWF
jgi:hypothetical protein